MRTTTLKDLFAAHDAAIEARRGLGYTREARERSERAADHVVDVLREVLPQLERVAADSRVEGAEAEHAAVIRWLLDHQGYTVGLALNAIDARDHHTNGGAVDAQAIEVRVDILDELQACWPEHRSLTDIARAIEYATEEDLEPHVAALLAAGFLEQQLDELGVPRWTTVPEVADQCVEAGWRVLAARSVGR